jgi:hypothetical protein
MNRDLTGYLTLPSRLYSIETPGCENPAQSTSLTNHITLNPGDIGPKCFIFGWAGWLWRADPE